MTDVADALIMTKLFGTMWKNGTVVVATSNRQPDELYENGLNRHYFLPFIDTLKKQCKLHDMNSVLDHRMLMTSNTTDQNTKYIVIDSHTGDHHVRLDKAFHEMKEKEINNTVINDEFNTNDEEKDQEEQEQVTVPTAFGRTLQVPKRDCYGGIVRFHFDVLFKSDLGAADYRSLAQRFHTIFVYDIPIMNHKYEKKNYFFNAHFEILTTTIYFPSFLISFIECTMRHVVLLCLLINYTKDKHGFYVLQMPSRCIYLQK